MLTVLGGSASFKRKLIQGSDRRRLEAGASPRNSVGREVERAHSAHGPRQNSHLPGQRIDRAAKIGAEHQSQAGLGRDFDMPRTQLIIR
jgi:hypothetical protein